MLRRPTIFREASVLAGVLLAFFGIIWAIMAMPRAAATDTGTGERLVTIHDRGNEKVVLTRATTVGDALKDAGLVLDEHDRTEPRVSLPLEANSYTVNVYRARPVIVVDGALRQKVMTAHQTARGIAAEVGLVLHDEDKTELQLSSDIIADGASQQMVVSRATELTLELYGQQTTIYTQSKTVGDMLKAKKITLAADDTLSVSAHTPVTAGMTVAIWRNGVQTQTREEVVAFGTRQVQAPDQPVGYKQVQTPGKNGKKMVTYQIEMRNGAEVSRAAIQSVVTEQPVEQVEIVGTKLSLPPGSHEDWMRVAGMSPSDFGYINAIFAQESGWNPASRNPSGKYVGLGQTNPATLSAACPQWQSDPICQIRFFDRYKDRYGSWENAYYFKFGHPGQNDGRGWW